MSFEVERIILHKFTGMWLNDIETFDMTVKDFITLILGRNGSGKSRLMAQLSAFCPEKDDFFKGGYRELHVKKDGVHFLLRVEKRGGDLRCEVKNLDTDEVICSNANPKVFNDNLQSMFKINRDVHALFTGKVSITKMSVGERRKWFSLLSDSDLTYPFAFYKKAKENARDISGGIKAIKTSIGELQVKVLEDESERESLKERIGFLEADINIINDKLTTLNFDESITESDFDRLDREINDINDRVLKMKHWVPVWWTANKSNELHTELSVNQERYNGLQSKLEDIILRMERSVSLSKVDVNALQRQKDALEKELEEYEVPSTYRELLECSVQTLTSDFGKYQEIANGLVGELGGLSTKIPLDRLYSRVQEADKVVVDLTTKRAMLNAADERFAEELKHAEGIHDVDCPKCKFRFKPGVDEERVSKLRVGLDNIAKEKVSVDKAITDGEATLEAFRNAHASMENIRSLLSAPTSINRLLNILIIKSEMVMSNPSRAASICKYVGEVTEIAINRLRTAERIEKLGREIEIANATTIEDLETLTKHRLAIESDLDKIIINGDAIKLQLNESQHVDETQQQLEILERIHSELLNKYSRVDAVLDANILADTLKRHSAYLWGILASAKQRYFEMESTQTKLKNYQEQLERLTERKVNADKIVAAMSPDEGILAKYLYASITRVTDAMTTTINSIWGYPVQVLPCNVKDGEIDYKFPYWVGSDDKSGKDVSDSSTAQRAVFDFAFVLIAYRSLGLSGYPLFVDETLSSFDDGHRDMAIKFIKNLINSNMFSQCFIVSHDADTHFKLTNAGAVVIDPNGIILPPVFNTHVIISK